MRGWMVGVLGVLVVLLTPAAARAQTSVPSSPALAYNEYPPVGASYGYGSYDSAYVQRARTTRGVGIALTVAGAVSLPMGIVLASAGGGCWYAGNCGHGVYSALTALGAVGIVGGGASLAVGIPLWAVGSRRLRQAGYGEIRASLLPVFNVDRQGGPTGTLLTTLRF